MKCLPTITFAKKSYWALFLFPLQLLYGLSSCKSNTNDSPSSIPAGSKILIDTVPAYAGNDLTGVGTYYSLTDSDRIKGRYILLNNLSEDDSEIHHVALMTINNRLVTFRPDSTGTFRSEEYELIIDVDKGDTLHNDANDGDHVEICKGFLRLKSKNGDSVIKQIIGEAGC